MTSMTAFSGNDSGSGSGSGSAMQRYLYSWDQTSARIPVFSLICCLREYHRILVYQQNNQAVACNLWEGMLQISSTTNRAISKACLQLLQLLRHRSVRLRLLYCFAILL
jgi:hypothetical protein